LYFGDIELRKETLALSPKAKDMDRIAHRIVVLAVALLFSNALSAQLARPSCEAVYRQALNDFNAGKLDRVIAALSECADNRNNSRPLRREMLSLLATVYTYLDEDENAEQAYLNLLELDPFHLPGIDAPELAYLSERFVTYPKFTFYVFGGPYLHTQPDVFERYSAPEVTVGEESYRRNSSDTPGSLFGFNLAVNVLHPRLDLGIGYTFSTMNFRYQARLENALRPDEVRDAAQLTFFEQHRWSHIPLYLNYRLAQPTRYNSTQLIPHLYAGISIDRMHQASARLIAPTIVFEQTEEEVSAGIVPLEDLRNSLNTSFMAGAGLKLHRRGFFFGADIQYTRMLRNLVDEKARFSNALLVRTFNYVDSDFRIDNLSVKIGVGYFFFRSKRKYAP